MTEKPASEGLIDKFWCLAWPVKLAIVALALPLLALLAVIVLLLMGGFGPSFGSGWR